MAFEATVSETRFGYGPSPVMAAPGSVDDILEGLTRADDMAARFPIERYPPFFARLGERSRLKRQLGEADDANQAGLRRQIKAINQRARRGYSTALGASILRRVYARCAFRERLESFWASHFTAMGKSTPIRFGAPAYVESAIRPHIAGHFPDLLIAAVTHPLMLHYLDQKRAMGPASPRGRAMRAGLNENLAREVLELHTLGSAGPYMQRDVRGLAELLTGLSSEPGVGTVYRAEQAEPGDKTILGETFAPRLEDVHRALTLLALHPSTARAVCTKVARHFLSDTPPTDLCHALAEVFLATDGNLPSVYDVMLRHDASWSSNRSKIRMPFDFVATACRGLSVSEACVAKMREDGITEIFAQPLRQMGQDWLRPSGPDGFSDEASTWVTPSGMAARLHWALSAPTALCEGLPDPRQISALYPDMAIEVVSEAETRAQGLAVMLMSPTVQRY